MAGENLSHVRDAQRSDISECIFKRCDFCGAFIPPRRFSQRSLAKRDGVMCVKCGGKAFRYAYNAPLWEELKLLFFHPSLIRKTKVWPKRWRSPI